MSVELKVPKISEDTDSGTVAEIYVSTGDTVEEGQSIIAVDSDKASVDIPAEDSGTVESIAVSEGDEIHTGDLILTLEEGDAQKQQDRDDSESEDEEETQAEAEDVKKQSGDTEEENDTSPDQGDKSEEQEEQTEAQTEESGQKETGGGEEEEEEEDSDKPKAPAAKSGGEQKEKASAETPPSQSEADHLAESPSAPLAKQFARELGIDIHEVPASGERVTRADVMAYAKKQIQRGGSAQPATNGQTQGWHPIQMPDFSKFGEVERQPLSSIRSAIATNTLQSWQNVPHVTHHDKAAARQLLPFQEQQQLSMTAIMTKIVAEALRRFPKFNASLDLEKEEVIYKKYIHIGVAVDTEDGLLMPVLRDVDQKPINELSEELEELAQKARNRKLQPQEMQGGNFVVSNLGGIGGTSFTPVIFPPQAAILGISATQTEAVYEEGQFEPKAVIPLSLSYDHRLIDGAEAARFVRWICEVMEQPLRLLS